MEAKKARGDIILYSVLTLVGIIFYVFIIPGQIYISKTAGAEAFSPDTFPNAVTILFVIASLCGLVLAVHRYHKAVQLEGKPQKDTTPRSSPGNCGRFYAAHRLFVGFALCDSVYEYRIYSGDDYRSFYDFICNWV